MDPVLGIICIIFFILLFLSIPFIRHIISSRLQNKHENHMANRVKSKVLGFNGVVDYKREAYYVREECKRLYAEQAAGLQIPDQAVLITCLNQNSFIMRNRYYFWYADHQFYFFLYERFYEDYDAIELNKVVPFICDYKHIIAIRHLKKENLTEMIFLLGQVEASLYFKYTDYDAICEVIYDSGRRDLL